jgi:prepilin-type N-terminal cleavage/methylation domain-containing protein
MKRGRPSGQGFTILELIMAMAIFLIICAAMFELLNLSQKKYSSETQLTAAYQDARLALDQIVRDVNVSGFPPAGLYSVAPSNPQSFASYPVAWSPGYTASPQPVPCLIGTAGGGTCLTPGDYDLVVETRLGTDTTVSWIWYHLDGTTLYRTVVQKTGSDPPSWSTSSAQAVAFLANVMNNAPTAQPALLTQINANYPSMFPSGASQPIFQYSCDTPAGTMPCPLAGIYNSPQNIRDVDVTLIVMTPQPDMQTQALKFVELNGRGHRLNPIN